MYVSVSTRIGILRDALVLRAILQIVKYKYNVHEARGFPVLVRAILRVSPVNYKIKYIL